MINLSFIPSLSIYFYLLSPGIFLGSFSTLRSSLSLAIIFYASSILFLRKKHFLFIVLCMLSISIHYTSIIPILTLIYIYNFHNNKIYNINVCYFLIVLSLVLGQTNLMQFILTLFEGKYQLYQSWTDRQSIYKILLSNIFSIIIIHNIQNYKFNKPFIFNIWF